MPAPSGWQLVTVNGTRRAIDPQGRETSYYAYLSAQAQQSGFANHTAYVKWERQNREFLRDFRKKAENKEALQLGGRGLARMLQAFFRSDLTRRTTAPSTLPRQPLARFLETVGMRPIDWPYSVGEREYNPYGQPGF